MENAQEKKCIICNAYFSTNQYNKVYCSHKCYKYAYRLRDKEKISSLQIYKYETNNNYRLKMIEKSKQYELINKNKRKQYRSQYRQTEMGKLVKKREYQKNKEKYSEYFKKYRTINKDKIKTSLKRIMEKEESKIKARLRNKKYRFKLRNIENERRLKLGLPLVGEGFLNEHKLRMFLDKHMLDMGQYYDNKFWKLEGDNLVKTTSRHGLQLDRFYPDANLSFEYDGEQHSMFIPSMHNTIKDLYAQRKRDKKKNHMCEKANVALIRVSYQDKIDIPTMGEKFKNHPSIEMGESIII